jgi:hypothetical protein
MRAESMIIIEVIKGHIVSHLRECYRHTATGTKSESLKLARETARRHHWGGTFQMEALCCKHNMTMYVYHTTPYTSFWEVINPSATSTKVLYADFQGDHFNALAPARGVNEQWLITELRVAVANPPQQWPKQIEAPLDPYDTTPYEQSHPLVSIPKAKPPSRSKTIIDLVKDSPEVRRAKRQSEMDTIADLMDKATKESTHKALAAVRPTLQRHFSQTIGRTGDQLSVAYGMNTTSLGGSKHHQQLPQKTLFVNIGQYDMSTEEELPLQTIELIKHLEQKYAILVTVVASHSPENLTAHLRKEHPVWLLQSLCNRRADEEIKRDMATSTQSFGRVTLKAGQFKERWMYFLETPGADIILRYAEIERRKPYAPIKYRPTNWAYFAQMWKTSQSTMRNLSNLQTWPI